MGYRRRALKSDDGRERSSETGALHTACSLRPAFADADHESAARACIDFNDCDSTRMTDDTIEQSFYQINTCSTV